MERLPIPLSRSILGCSDGFPRPNRDFLVESSIEDREVQDILPFNSTTDGRLTDIFTEFIIHPTSSFIDLNNIVLEISGEVLKEDDSQWLDDDKFDICNNALHSLIKSVQVSLNGCVVESNPYYSISAMVKSLTSFRPSDLKSYGYLCGLRHASDGTKNYTDSYFNGLNEDGKRRISDLKSHGFNYKGKLHLDISSISQYLLNGVEMKIKLEFNPDPLIINAPTLKPKIRINGARLHVTTLKPRSNAAAALDTRLESIPMTYNFQKLLHKTYIIPTNSTMFSCESPFMSQVPQSLYLAMVDMNAFAGSDYSKNGYYFDHFNLKELQVTVNNKVRYSSSSQFPHGASGLIYDSLSALGPPSNHLIDCETFIKGCSIISMSFLPEFIDDHFPNQSGNLRVTLSLQQPVNHNILLFMFGLTEGLIQVDSSRKVSLAVLG